MQQPNVPSKYVHDYELIWNDEFNDNKLNDKKWRKEKILPDYKGNKAQMSQHVTNTRGFDTEGNLIEGKYPYGKRHAVWYDKHLDKTLGVENGALVMGAYVSDEDDPTIKDSHHPYTHPRNGKLANFKKKIYTSWIDTYAMTWHEDAVRPAPQSSPNFFYRYGLIELCVNFELMKTEGLRNSGWLLPGVDPDAEDVALVGGTYDEEAANGLECDIFEYENSPGAEHMLLCKNIGANAKKIPPVDCRKFGIDITKGDHTIAVYWDDASMVWFVDGIEVCRDDDAIVHISMAIYLTREGNSGAGGGDGIDNENPFIQKDPGLWGYNIGTESKEKIDADKACIKYVRVYQNPSQKDNWIGRGWRNGEGIDNSIVDTVVSVATPSKTPLFPESTDIVKADFELTVEGNVLRWNKTHPNNKYDVKFNDNEYKTSVEGTEFVIPDDFAEGTYYVTSTPDDKNFVDSNKVIFNRNDKPAAPAMEPVTESKRRPVVVDKQQNDIKSDDSTGDKTAMILILKGIMELVNKLLAIIEKK